MTQIYAGQIIKYSNTNWWIWTKKENEFGRLGHWVTKEEIDSFSNSK